MSSHALRPLVVALALVALLVVVQRLYVPGDFGVQARGYTYGWYRERSVADWKWAAIKYQGRDFCAECHRDEAGGIRDMPHASIECENCHGPALGHPDDPARLAVDTRRELCLRCHARLPYPSSARGGLRSIDPATHNPDRPCVECHLPHQPTLQNLRSPEPGRRQLNATCRPCHQNQVDEVVGMPHEIIYCERCHGPAGNHPSDPPRLVIDETRKACLKCHVGKTRHNFGRTCVTCHDPHKSSLLFLRFEPSSGEGAR
jgi:predicted CXXCH cytochrome family protein